MSAWCVRRQATLTVILSYKGHTVVVFSLGRYRFHPQWSPYAVGRICEAVEDVLPDPTLTRGWFDLSLVERHAHAAAAERHLSGFADKLNEQEVTP